MANPSIPIFEPTPAFVTRVTPAFVYENEKKTDRRVLDELGRPITRVRAFGSLFGSVGEFTLVVPDQAVESVNVNDVVIAEGTNVVADLRGGDYGSVNSTIRGAEHLRGAGNAQQVFEQLAKQASK